MIKVLIYKLGLNSLVFLVSIVYLSLKKFDLYIYGKENYKFEEYKANYKKSITNPEKFWEEKAEILIDKKWENVLSWDFKSQK